MGTAVGGTGVAVGVLDGSDVVVEVGTIISLGVAVDADFGSEVVQDASPTTHMESKAAMKTVFTRSLLCMYGGG